MMVSLWLQLFFSATVASAAALKTNQHAEISAPIVTEPANWPHRQEHRERRHGSRLAHRSAAEHSGTTGGSNVTDQAVSQQKTQAKQHVVHDKPHNAETRSDGLGYSLCLMGAVAFMMSLLYLINHNDAGVVLATWQVLSMTLSIFAAVLMYGTARTMTIDSLDTVTNESRTGHVVVASLTLFLCIYVTTEGVLYLLKAPRYKEVLHSGAALSCHFLGFSACYGFADLQRTAFFSSSVLINFSVTAIAALALLALAYVARMVHTYVETLHGSRSKEHLEDLRWEHHVELMENEALALTIGFLLVQSIAFGIRGTHSSINALAAPVDVREAHARLILYWAGFFTLMTIGGAYGVTVLVKKRGLKQVEVLNFESFASNHVVSFDIRIAMALQNAMGVSMAWCLLLWAEWQVYALEFPGPRSAACMLVGLCLTLLAFMAIFVLEITAEHIHTSDIVDPEKVVRSLTLTLGIVIGFAWERAFHVGLHDVAHAVPAGDISRHTIERAASIVLILIVVPAWGMYIFPQVEIAKERGHQKYGVSLTMTPSTTQPQSTKRAFQRPAPLKFDVGMGADEALPDAATASAPL